MRMRVFNNNGVTMVLFTIATTLIIGIAALVIDVGTAMVERQKFQNAIDAATLAAATELPNANEAVQKANEYINLNGFDSSLINIQLLNNNSEISITGNKNVEFFFAKILGIKNMTTTVSSSAAMETIGEAFNYALFSGSSSDILALNGSSFYIDGNTHTNYKFRMNGSNQVITGACEAVSTITTNGSSINIGERVPNAPFINMPDFSDTIKLQAQENGTLFNSSKTYNGSQINVGNSIYVNGNITVNGSRFSGQGSMLATGDITFNGSNLTQSTSDSVCFYSKDGDITINGSNATINGIIYAPNGTVSFNGSNQTVYGRIIANKIRINGSSNQIISGSSDLNSLPSHGVKLIK